MATIKLKKGKTIKDLLKKGDAKQLSQKGGDDKGELSSKDGSLVINYTISGESAEFKMTKAPKMFKGDEEKILKKLFS
jgi:hypothetical protein